MGSCITSYIGASENIIVPELVTEITGGNSTFGGKTFIKSVQLPSTLKSLMTSIFNGCSGLTTVTFANNSQLIWKKAPFKQRERDRLIKQKAPQGFSHKIVLVYLPIRNRIIS